VKGNVKAGGLVQVVKHLLSIASEGSEFKPQYHKKKKKSMSKIMIIQAASLEKIFSKTL
jgi:hypothetical protein